MLGLKFQRIMGGDRTPVAQINEETFLFEQEISSYTIRPEINSNDFGGFGN